MAHQAGNKLKLIAALACFYYIRRCSYITFYERRLEASAILKSSAFSHLAIAFLYHTFDLNRKLYLHFLLINLQLFRWWKTILDIVEGKKTRYKNCLVKIWNLFSKLKHYYLKNMISYQISLVHKMIGGIWWQIPICYQSTDQTFLFSLVCLYLWLNLHTTLEPFYATMLQLMKCKIYKEKKRFVCPAS